MELELITREGRTICFAFGNTGDLAEATNLGTTFDAWIESNRETYALAHAPHCEPHYVKDDATTLVFEKAIVVGETKRIAVLTIVSKLVSYLNPEKGVSIFVHGFTTNTNAACLER